MLNRVILLFDKTTNKAIKFKELEARTGISADSWKKAYAGKQRLTQEMIESICKMYPDCCLWLTTGMTDEKNGQYDIDGHIALEKHSLAHVLKKPPREWTSDEVKVVRIWEKRTLRAYEERGLVSNLSTLVDALENYDKSKPDRCLELLVSDGETAPTVVLWRDIDGTHANINVQVNLREPFTPADFEWGYHGTGPRQLAANVLMHFGCAVEDAKLLATDFSLDVISKLNRETDSIKKSDVEQWMLGKGQKSLQAKKGNSHID